VLNLAMRAVDDLDLGNEVLRFRARFSGASYEIVVPVAAVRAIYAQENGQGMMFPADAAGAEPASEPSPDEPSGPRPTKGPKLRVVK
jgi:stringent starvation protein B